MYFKLPCCTELHCQLALIVELRLLPDIANKTDHVHQHQSVGVYKVIQAVSVS